MGKGATKDAFALSGKANNLSDKSTGQSDQSYNELFPFLTNEVTNPTGLGPLAKSQMMTQGGEEIGGAVGGADEQARLAASRTGNTSALSSIIGDTARAGMKQGSDNALTIALKDAALKQQQQQAGASGLNSLYDTQTTNALKALGISDEALNTAVGSRAQTNNALMGWTKLGLNELGQSNPAAALGMG